MHIENGWWIKINFEFCKFRCRNDETSTITLYEAWEGCQSGGQSSPTTEAATTTPPKVGHASYTRIAE